VAAAGAVVRLKIESVRPSNSSGSTPKRSQSVLSNAGVALTQRPSSFSST